MEVRRSEASTPRRSSTAATTTATTAIAGPDPSNRLKAAPVLKTRRRRRVQTMSMTRPPSRALTAHHLVS